MHRTTLALAAVVGLLSTAHAEEHFRARAAVLAVAPAPALARRQVITEASCPAAATSCAGTDGCCPIGSPCTVVQGEPACKEACGLKDQFCETGLCCPVGYACPTARGEPCRSVTAATHTLTRESGGVSKTVPAEVSTPRAGGGATHRASPRPSVAATTAEGGSAPSVSAAQSSPSVSEAQPSQAQPTIAQGGAPAVTPALGWGVVGLGLTGLVGIAAW